MTAESAARELADSWFKDRGAGKKELADLITAALKRCRNEALDEAAGVCERSAGCLWAAAGIKALKKVEPLTEEEIETIDATVG